MSSQPSVALPSPSTRHRPFWNLVQVGGLGDCWPWLGYISEFGYGKHTPYPGKCVRAHRYAYELWNGKGSVLRGLDIDHVCHTSDESCAGGVSCPHRACVNPAHLRLATRSANLRDARFPNKAKTECPSGHPLSGDNLYIYPNGRRGCRSCRTAQVRRWKEKQR